MSVIGEVGPQMNKSKQVSNDHHQISLAGCRSDVWGVFDVHGGGVRHLIFRGVKYSAMQPMLWCILYYLTLRLPVGRWTLVKIITFSKLRLLAVKINLNISDYWISGTISAGWTICCVSHGIWHNGSDHDDWPKTYGKIIFIVCLKSFWTWHQY